jgi:hypothetical protein
MVDLIHKNRRIFLMLQEIVINTMDQCEVVVYRVHKEDHVWIIQYLEQLYHFNLEPIHFHLLHHHYRNVSIIINIILNLKVQDPLLFTTIVT